MILLGGATLISAHVFSKFCCLYRQLLCCVLSLTRLPAVCSLFLAYQQDASPVALLLSLYR